MLYGGKAFLILPDRPTPMHAQRMDVIALIDRLCCHHCARRLSDIVALSALYRALQPPATPCKPTLRRTISRMGGVVALAISPLSNSSGPPQFTITKRLTLLSLPNELQVLRFRLPNDPIQDCSVFHSNAVSVVAICHAVRTVLQAQHGCSSLGLTT